jgi:Hydantoinase/oxoprolinase
MRIGIRVGTSKAHGVLMDHDRVLAAESVPLGAVWTEPLATLLRDLAAAAPNGVDSVSWDVSAVLESALGRVDTAPPSETTRTQVLRARPVAAVRVVPRATKTAGIGGHPSALVRSLVAWRGTVTGGHDLFGHELATLDLDAVMLCARTAEATGLTTLAITATGASTVAVHEEQVAARLLERYPDLRLCLSHESGGLGLLEREATTVVNAALLDVTETVVTRCERATASLGTRVSCWFATGDGGRVSAKRLRWVPAAGLAATPAAALIGAAALSGSHDAVVALTGPSTITIGQVRDGLPHVEADLPRAIGVRMTAPQAVLTVSEVHTAAAAASLLTEQSRRTTDVVAVLDEGGFEVADQVLRDTGHVPVLLPPTADIAAVGTACTEASAWLDLLIPVDTTEELERLQTRAEQQALTLVAANGAQPGNERIVRSAATALGYLRQHIYRLQVRATSRPGPGVRA